MRDNMKILIGGAWPYANGSLHIGHIAGLLPADVIARYFRAKGDTVYFVSGSDCHGTPVVIRAKQENKTPEQISNFFHEEFIYCFNKLGFSYDLYTKTSTNEHKEFVKEFHERLYLSKYIYEKSSPQAYCNKCNSFITDRFVLGKCPSCLSETRGDQCDTCGFVLEPENLIQPKCAICGSDIEFKDSTHLYIAISKLEKQLKDYINSHTNWRKNAISFSNRYIDEGLKDRAITRDLEWGIDVPKKNYKDKKIYIWAENVLGYLSASKVLSDSKDESFEELWGENARHYYVHGKDNIPFHTIILPALIICNDSGYHLPDEIISSEYLTLEGSKISTSRNHAIWIKDIIEKYDSDSIRYFLISNGPEKRDADFTWNEFINSHNGELLGSYGNFVNRTLIFIEKYFDNKIPEGILDDEISSKTNELYEICGFYIEKANLKDALDKIFEFVRYSNKYFDTQQPWKTRTDDLDQCKNTLYNCTQIIANLAVLLKPFIPFSSEKVCNWLNICDEWRPHYIDIGYIIPRIDILFNRINKIAPVNPN